MAPDLDALRIGFIGAGRLGKALAWICSRHSLQVVDTCDLVFVTTPDEVIRRTAESLRWHPSRFVVHCSGATEVSDLTKAASDGASIGSRIDAATAARVREVLAG